TYALVSVAPDRPGLTTTARPETARYAVYPPGTSAEGKFGIASCFDGDQQDDRNAERSTQSRVILPGRAGCTGSGAPIKLLPQPGAAPIPTSPNMSTFTSEPLTRPEDIDLLIHSAHWDPFSVLGPHEVTVDGKAARIIRAFLPEARQAWVVDLAGGEPG